MSLQDELLRVGLVSKEKAKKAKADTRKQTHRAKKAGSAAETEQQLKQQQQAEANRKRERDRQLNLERAAQKKHKEDMARVSQLIASNRLNDDGAEARYNFLLDGRYIRSVQVTPKQQQLLAMGRIGIARNQDDEYDYPLLPREILMKLAKLLPDSVLLLHPESGGSEAADEVNVGDFS